MRMPTVIAKTTNPARRFSSHTRTRPMKAVRKGRNIYIEEFYRRMGTILKTEVYKGLLYRIKP
jgi:hypothetical protein